jgi:hypothetical protein
MPCWVKVFLVCYKFQKVFGTCASFDETVCWWVNGIKNGQEETDYAPCSLAQLLEMDNITSEVCPWIYAQHLLQKLEPLQQVFTILTSNLGKWKVCTKWIPCVLNNDQESCFLLTTYLLHWKKGGNAFLDYILTVNKLWMRLTLGWNDRMLNGMPQCHWIIKLHGAVRVLWKSCMSCFTAEMGFCSTIWCQLVWRSVANITVLSCRVRWDSTSFLLSRSHHIWLLGVCTYEKTSSG